jgi:hypothetical protein
MADTTELTTKRKSNGRNSPVIGDNGYDLENTSLVGKILTESLESYRMEKVHSDEELLDRLDQYFTRCAAKDIKPTVEEMCMYTGYVRSTIWDWETGRKGGFSPRTGDIIKKAKEYIALFDARLLLEGKLNPVSYIFRSKNYYGMKDVQDVVLSPNNPLGDGMSPEDVRKLADSLPAPSDCE